MTKSKGMTMNWKDEFWIAGVSETGSGHLQAEEECEDSFYTARDGKSFVIAVCDGAGSAAKARIGASVVSTVLGQVLLRNASEVMAGTVQGKTIVSVAQAALNIACAHHGGTLDDYACTLVALLVHEGELMTCHIGDGAIFVLESEHPRFLSPPKRRGRGTFFVTSDEVQPRMWKRKLRPYMTGFLIATDGADALANTVTGEASQVVGRIVNQLDLAPEECAPNLLREVCESTLSPTTADDITLVAARRAFAAGSYGCPECYWPRVRLGVGHDRSVFRGRCSHCGHIVFSTHDPLRVRTYEFIHEESLRAHGLFEDVQLGRRALPSQ